MNTLIPMQPPVDYKPQTYIACVWRGMEFVGSSTGSLTQCVIWARTQQALNHNYSACISPADVEI